MNIYRQRESRSFLALRCIVFFFIFFIAFPSFCQWRKIAQFDAPIHTIYFLEDSIPKVGFCGTGGGWGSIKHWAETWRTSDGGKSWTETGDFGGGYDITAITFKDSLTGWLGLYYPFYENIAETTDGGLSWNTVDKLNIIFKGLATGCNDIYYHKYSHTLFVTTWFGPNYYSSYFNRWGIELVVH